MIHIRLFFFCALLASCSPDEALRPGSSRCPVFPSPAVWSWAARTPEVAVIVNSTSGCVVKDPALTFTTEVIGPDGEPIPATIERNTRRDEGEFIVRFDAASTGWHQVSARFEPNWGSSRVRVLVGEAASPPVQTLPFACGLHAGVTEHGTWFCYNQALRDDRTLQILSAHQGGVADDILWVAAPNVTLQFERLLDTGEGPLTEPSVGGTVAVPVKTGNDTVFFGRDDVLVAGFEGGLNRWHLDGGIFEETASVPLPTYVAVPSLRWSDGGVQWVGQMSDVPPRFEDCHVSAPLSGTLPPERIVCTSFDGWYLGSGDGVLWMADEEDRLHAVRAKDGGTQVVASLELPPFPSAGELQDEFADEPRPWKAAVGNVYDGARHLGPPAILFTPPIGAFRPPVFLVPRFGEDHAWFELFDASREQVTSNSTWLMSTRHMVPVQTRFWPLP